MNARYRTPLFVLAVLAASAVTCVVTGRLARCVCERTPEPPGERLRRELALSPEQQPAVDALEREHAARAAGLSARIGEVNRELAAAIRETGGASPRVAAAVLKNHELQAALQQAALDRVFGLKDVLTPAQYGKLLDLTANAIEGGGR
ncbi:MAG: periplasmic heavy metal sensor [Opitutaceae bacterium]|jgi:hypothetical protein|nr:periplasmic heavy metal sensor [Opitutaceae bacterium]